MISGLSASATSRSRAMSSSMNLMGAKRIAAGENRGALALERHVVITGHPVDPGHQMALCAKPPRQMKADEPCRAGDQDAHVGRPRA